jgi:hypothetical protein
MPASTTPCSTSPSRCRRSLAPNRDEARALHRIKAAQRTTASSSSSLAQISLPKPTPAAPPHHCRRRTRPPRAKPSTPAQPPTSTYYAHGRNRAEVPEIDTNELVCSDTGDPKFRQLRLRRASPTSSSCSWYSCASPELSIASLRVP